MKSKTEYLVDLIFEKLLTYKRRKIILKKNELKEFINSLSRDK